MQAFDEQIRVRVPPGDDVRDLFVGPQDGVRVREHDPDREERDREEVPEEHREGRRDTARKERQWSDMGSWGGKWMGLKVYVPSEKRDGAVDAVPAPLKVLEAADAEDLERVV